MTTTTQSVVFNIQTALQDVDGTRWPATEIVSYLNDGQRDIAALRPDLFTATAPLVLATGAKQTLPAACSKLIDIPRNTSGAAIRQVDQSALDAVEPTWYTRAGSTTVKNVCFDPRDPSGFWVYPPASSGASVDLVYAILPADLATPGGAAFGTATGNLTVGDVFKNALTHYGLFRCWSKDAEFGGNAALASANYQLYQSLLASELASRQAVAPT